MKKVFLPLILGLVFGACSRDNDENVVNNGTGNIVQPSEPVLLLSKMVNVEENGDIETTIFKYEGDKIMEISGGYEGGWSHITKHYYTGDLITSITDNSKLKDGSISKEETKLTYNAEGKLVKVVSIYTENQKDGTMVSTTTSTKTYAYNADGTVVMNETEKREYFTQPQLNSEEKKKITYTLVNGQIVKLVEEDERGVDTTTYTYDDKNSPIKNVRGIEAAYLYIIGEDYGIKNNILSYKRVSANNNDTIEQQNTLKYNVQGYPIEIKEKNKDSYGSNIREESYTLEYIEFKK